MVLKGNMKHLCGDGNVLCLDYTEANILIVIIYYSFTRYCHRKQLGNSIIFTASCEYIFKINFN